MKRRIVQILMLITVMLTSLLDAEIKPASPVAETPIELAEMRVGNKYYYQVRVTSVTPKTVSFRHSKGLAQVYLHDLSPELQDRFGYNPMAAKQFDRNKRKLMERARQQTQDNLDAWREHRLAASTANNKVQEAIATAGARFGTPADIHSSVDFTDSVPIKVKSQGRHPSCSVFAIIGAVELQYARIKGYYRPFSETYSVWATREYLGLTQQTAASLNVQRHDLDEDAGFSLTDVLSASTVHGFVDEDAMPYRNSVALSEISAPSDQLRQEALRLDIEALPVPSAGAQRVDNIIHALNEGLPVVIGVKWPSFRGIQHGTIALQTPREDYAHAVTLYGYQSSEQDPQSTRFLFKNSWGRDWGKQGHGSISYAYLEAHLLSAYILDVNESALTDE